MIPQEEIADPQEALATIWGWLSSAGPHFSGAWRLEELPGNKEVQQATFQVQGLPEHLNKPVREVIRLVALTIGWKATRIGFSKEQVTFMVAPYPFTAQEHDRARSEEFRQAWRKKREETQQGQ